MSKDMLESLKRTSIKPPVRKVINIEQNEYKIFVKDDFLKKDALDNLKNTRYKPAVRKLTKLDPDTDVIHFESR